MAALRRRPKSAATPGRKDQPVRQFKALARKQGKGKTPIGGKPTGAPPGQGAAARIAANPLPGGLAGAQAMPQTADTFEPGGLSPAMMHQMQLLRFLRMMSQRGGTGLMIPGGPPVGGPVD